MYEFNIFILNNKDEKNVNLMKKLMLLDLIEKLYVGQFICVDHEFYV
jgi:hypothetical protein